jgi:hypothetical protein
MLPHTLLRRPYCRAPALHPVGFLLQLIHMAQHLPQLRCHLTEAWPLLRLLLPAALGKRNIRLHTTTSW